MTVNELTLLTIYKVSASNGKARGGVKRIEEMLGMSKEEMESKLSNFDAVLSDISKLPKEAIEAILSTASFIMNADGKIDPNELAIISQIEDLLK